MPVAFSSYGDREADSDSPSKTRQQLAVALLMKTAILFCVMWPVDTSFVAPAFSPHAALAAV